MKQPRPTTVDFESFPIRRRPHYPPAPVGVSIKKWGKKPHYFSWGHPDENNCTWHEGRLALLEAFSCPDGVLFHNSKFDVELAVHRMGVPMPSWDKIHDTMFLLFLDDPHQIQLGLKPSAERLLDLPSEERDAVVEWLIEHQPVPDVKLSRSRQSPNYAGAWVAVAPGSLVGAYANGDVVRTEKLFELLWAKTRDRGMLESYDRERKLMPVLLSMEQHGARVDQERLGTDISKYTGWLRKLDAWVIKRLQCDPNINLDSGTQLADAMIEAGVADASLMGVTKGGKVQTNKESLAAGVTDKVLAGVLKYRTQLSTCLKTFMTPWYITACHSGGLIYTTWNQTKSTESGGSIGTRTGRLSSTPNFQNIPKEFEAIFAHFTKDKELAKKLPKCPWPDLPQLPLCRGYLVPMFEDHVLLGRDYCFSPDTEVLTEKGFQRWDQLDRSLKLAQWNCGEVTYAQPLEYQVFNYEGPMVHVVGERSADLLMTPNHRCVLVKNHLAFVLPASDYPLGNRGFKQVHAGVYRGTDDTDLAVLQLVAAVQADATVTAASVIWKMKKVRKHERLAAVLSALGLSSRATPTTDGMVAVRVCREDVERLVDPYLDLWTKTFRRALLEVQASKRLAFLIELSLWDGRRQGIKDTSWSYFSTNVDNAELVVELAAVTGLRANTNTKTLDSSKSFQTVNMRLNSLTWTNTFTKTVVPYKGKVYCATMPDSTLIVRRNGKICVTGNSQQELRILGHFEGGVLMDAYLKNNWLDVHDYARDMINRMLNRNFDRKPIKNTGFGLIYGMGLGKLALKSDIEIPVAKQVKDAYLATFPGLKDMYGDMKSRAKNNEPIRTWGQREYYCEPPRIVEGRIREFDYKLVNVLIQGSAADCTKEALIRFFASMVKHKKVGVWYLLLQVHDEVVISVPKKDVALAMTLLREAMESVEFDVPMLSEGAWSNENWASMKDYDTKGETVHAFAT